MSFPKYERYKDSGVEWLGEVPDPWTVYRSKVVFAERNVKAAEKDEQLTASQKYGVIPQKLFSELEEHQVMQVIVGRSILKKAEVNDFVISMRSFQGGLEFCPYSGAISSAYVPLYAKREIENAFFKYLFKAEPFISALQQTSNLVRDGQALRYSNFTQLSLPFPTLVEQKKIGSMLDYETARIDALIAEQERLIALLKEKRQAVISHAVTKGCDPSVPMKDSGVEWLGEVPEHWKVCRLKDVSVIVDCKNRTPEYFDDGEYLVVRTSNVKEDSLNLRNALYTNRENFEIWTQRGIPPVGSILFTREAPTGEVCLVPDAIPLCMGQRMMNVIPVNSLVTHFLFHFFTSDCLSRYIESESAGSTVTHLRVEQIYNIPIVIPSEEDQLKINQLVETMKVKFFRLIEEAYGSIDLLKERRSALISAAVTGKIDVRNWQPPTSTSPMPALEAVHS